MRLLSVPAVLIALAGVLATLPGCGTKTPLKLPPGQAATPGAAVPAQSAGSAGAGQ